MLCEERALGSFIGVKKRETKGDNRVRQRKKENEKRFFSNNIAINSCWLTVQVVARTVCVCVCVCVCVLVRLTLRCLPLAL